MRVDDDLNLLASILVHDEGERGGREGWRWRWASLCPMGVTVTVTVDE